MTELDTQFGILGSIFRYMLAVVTARLESFGFESQFLILRASFLRLQDLHLYRPQRRNLMHVFCAVWVVSKTTMKIIELFEYSKLFRTLYMKF